MTTQSSTFWFSHIWSTKDLKRFLPLDKALQRYITSWEALARLCIITTVFQKRHTRPGIIRIQSGSDNTGAEANINHGCCTTFILADIIKLVSLKQLQFNSFLHIHHIPGEKNIDADNLSRGKTSDFPDSTRVNFNLKDIFDQTPFPKYINNLVQWDSEIHPLAKFCFKLLSWGFVFFCLSPSLSLSLSPPLLGSLLFPFLPPPYSLSPRYNVSLPQHVYFRLNEAHQFAPKFLQPCHDTYVR